MTKSFKSSRQVSTAVLWMHGAIRTGEPVPVEQVESWAAMLSGSLEELKARETACFLAEDDPLAPKLGDRFSRIEAEMMVATGSGLVRSLARLALSGHPDQAVDIDQTACAIVGTLEALARGVARPAISLNHDQEGA